MEALLTFVPPVNASYHHGVLDKQKALHQNMEENLTSQATVAVSKDDAEDPNNLNACIDYIVTNISEE